MRTKNILKLLVMLVISVTSIAFVAAFPIGPRTVTNTSTRLSETNWPPYNITAYAGNITEMVIDTWTITRTWQGYVGNVTGTIVLADANNYTLYDWEVMNPSGEIYAARTDSIDWITIACANKTQILDINEAQFSGTNETDRDGAYPDDSPNLTFTTSGTHHTIYVGNITVANDTCPRTVMHNSTTWIPHNQTANHDVDRFHEVVLADNWGNGDTVYTALLEKDWAGFDGKTHDFEMIVAEDGHGTDVSQTPYYFWVQLSG